MCIYCNYVCFCCCSNFEIKVGGINIIMGECYLCGHTIVIEYNE